MCGIAGIVDGRTPVDERRTRVEQMCQAMVHRGPDSAGVVTSGMATLGTRRLAIFDPAHGDQPMTSADGRYVLVFNGAIYNFRELRSELENGGAIFRTQCDTEVLLAAWTKWGVACVPRLRGMFAFAIWDGQLETLSLARDRFGIKPLYFAHRGKRLVFASEIGALAAGLGESLTIDPVSISQYLGWLAVPAPRTLFQDVWSLRPGERATFAEARNEIVSWAHPASGSGQTRICATRDEFAHELRARLEDSIRAHCLADVPVGAFLSGGLDSSSIVALMARQAGAQLKTFSIGFEERDWDESDHAAEIARHLGTQHETRLVTGRELASELPRMLAAMDQPTGDGINSHLASQLARAGGVKVALSGLGADELLGGYPSFRQVPAIARRIGLWQRLPGAGRRVVLQQLRARGTGARKLADLLEHGGNVHEICALQRRVFSSDQAVALLSPGVRSRCTGSFWFHPALQRLAEAAANDTDVRTIVSRWETGTYMADVLLRDADVMSMRHSLELRVPFVDQPFVEWLTRQKAEFRFDARQPKSALFEALRDLLPPSLERRRKCGFTLPFPRWMRQELRPLLEETFSESSVRRSGLLSSPAVQSLWRSYLQGSDTREWSRVWSLAVLIQFVNRFSPPVGSAQPVRMEGAAPSAPVGGRGTDGAAPSMAENRTSACGTSSTFLLLAPELFAREGGIARMLRIYLRALVDHAGAEDRVRFVSLNDSPQDVDLWAGCPHPAGKVAAASSRRKPDHRQDAGATLRGEITPPPLRPMRASTHQQPLVWRACGGDKAHFVRAALQLARGSAVLICGHVAQLPVAFAAKMANPGLRILLVAHGIEVWRQFTTAEQLALQATDQILCVSRFTRDEMQRWISLPGSRFVILPNALDPDLAFASPPATRGAPVILSISRLDSADRYKGLDDLLRAMPAIRTRIPGATLRIIGRGNDLPRLLALRDELAIGDAVEFLGYCADDVVTGELSRCAVFALPSTREGFGLVFLEAMAAGRPCVGVRSGAVPELVTDGTGLLVPPHDVTALAHACVDALEQTWDHSRIIARAKEFSYPTFKERLSSLIAPVSPDASAQPLVTHP